MFFSVLDLFRYSKTDEDIQKRNAWEQIICDNEPSRDFLLNIFAALKGTHFVILLDA